MARLRDTGRRSVLSLGFVAAAALSTHAADYAVTPAFFDDIGEILTSLGLDWDQIEETDLSNITALRNYRTVFLNCSGTIETNLEDEHIAALRQFVSEGGVVYASDWAYIAIARAFPGYVTYHPSPKVGDVQLATTTIEDAGMRDYVGVSRFEVNFNLGGWVPIAGVDARTVSVFLRGENGDEHVSGQPILVKFDYGSGAVVYTSFHNEAGLDATSIKALEYMVLLSVMGVAANNLASYLRDRGYIPVKENIELVSPGGFKTFSYTHTATRGEDLAFAVGWRDTAAFNVLGTPPSGSAASGTSATTPAFVEFADAVSGAWTYRATPSGIVTDTPFVAMAAKRIAAYEQLEPIKAYPNPYRATEHNVVVFEGLPEQATIKIYTLTGRLVKTIHKNDGSGTAFWDANNQGGEGVAPGLYIVTAEDGSGKVKRGKVAITR